MTMAQYATPSQIVPAPMSAKSPRFRSGCAVMAPRSRRLPRLLPEFPRGLDRGARLGGRLVEHRRRIAVRHGAPHEAGRGQLLEREGERTRRRLRESGPEL